MTEPLESPAETNLDSDAARQPTVGERLSAAREARGLSVDDVASALKLGPRQVAALEAGDWQHLPGNTFIRGFVRNYARFLELEVPPLMDALNAVLEQPVDTLRVGNAHPAEMPAHASSSLFHKSRRAVIWVAVVALLAVIVAVVTLVASNASSLASLGSGWVAKVTESKSAEPVPAGEALPATVPASPQEPVLPPGTTPQQVLRPQALAPAEQPQAAAQPMPGAAVEFQGLRLVLGAVSLLEVRDADNKVVFFQRQLPAGAEQVFSLTGPVTITLGNAAGAHVFWKGREVDLAPHIKGNGARLVLE